MQLITSADFDGTTSTARLIQSNDIDLAIDDWNFLPEGVLGLIVGSNLLQTESFTCKYLAIVIDIGDATLGSINIVNHFNS